MKKLLILITLIFLLTGCFSEEQIKSMDDFNESISQIEDELTAIENQINILNESLSAIEAPELPEIIEIPVAYPEVITTPSEAKTSYTQDNITYYIWTWNEDIIIVKSTYHTPILSEPYTTVDSIYYNKTDKTFEVEIEAISLDHSFHDMKAAYLEEASKYESN